MKKCGHNVRVPYLGHAYQECKMCGEIVPIIPRSFRYKKRRGVLDGWISERNREVWKELGII